MGHQGGFVFDGSALMAHEAAFIPDERGLKSDEPASLAYAPPPFLSPSDLPTFLSLPLPSPPRFPAPLALAIGRREH